MTSASDFQANYERMSNEELLFFAADRENLVEGAVQALDNELQKRGLSTGKAAKLRRKVERIEARDTVGQIGLSFRGWGKQFLGASNYIADPAGAYEEFDSTLWGFAAFLPVLPISTIRIRRRRRGKSQFWSFSSTDYTPMTTRGIDFKHVLFTYIGAAAGAFLILQTLRFLLSALIQ